MTGYRAARGSLSTPAALPRYPGARTGRQRHSVMPDVDARRINIFGGEAADDVGELQPAVTSTGSSSMALRTRSLLAAPA